MASQRRKYDAAELRKINERLLSHQGALMSAVGKHAARLKKEIDFDVAVMLRDASQHLVCTILALKSIKTSIALSEHGGESQWLPFSFDEAGMKE